MKRLKPGTAQARLWIVLWGLMAGAWCGAGFGATLGCDMAQATAGDAGVWLSVSLSAEGDSVCAIQCDFTFDAEALSLADVDAGQAALDAGKDVQFSVIEPGRVRMIVAGFNQYVIDDGVVASLQFSVAASAPDGVYPVAPESLLLSDPYGIVLEGATLAGAVVVGESADVNGDGARDAVDVQLVVNRALGFLTEYDCDVNRDGSVNAVDIQTVINVVLGL